jgi:hypothetical protein
MSIFKNFSNIINNKYYKWYTSITKNAMDQQRCKGNSIYYERHHILPKSIYPQFKHDNNNLVLLTAKEHFICHMLLTKFMINKNDLIKVNYALFRLLYSNNTTQELYKCNSKSYEYAKICNAKATSLMFKGKKLSDQECLARSKRMMGNKNHRFGLPGTFLGKQHTEDTKQKMQKPKSEEGKANIKAAQTKINRTGDNNPMFGKYGSNNPNSKQLIIDGVTYDNIKQAKTLLKRSYYYIIKHCTFIE